MGLYSSIISPSPFFLSLFSFPFAFLQLVVVSSRCACYATLYVMKEGRRSSSLTQFGLPIQQVLMTCVCCVVYGMISIAVSFFLLMAHVSNISYISFFYCFSCSFCVDMKQMHKYSQLSLQCFVNTEYSTYNTCL